MIDRRKVLTVKTNFEGYTQIPVEVRQEVAKYFPYYLPEDGSEIQEEVYFIIYLMCFTALVRGIYPGPQKNYEKI